VIDLRGRETIVKLLIVLAIIVFVLPGCGQNDSASQKPSTGQKPKAPTAAEDVLESIDTIITELDRKIKMVKTPNLQNITESSEKETKSSQPDSSGGSAQDGGNSEANPNQQQEKQPEQAIQEQKTGKWQKEIQSLKELHSNWNTLEPQAAEAGFSANSRESFEKVLDELTLAISSQNHEQSYKYAIELYGRYGELAKVFAMPQPLEFYQVNYGTMAAIAEASSGEWENAEDRMLALEAPRAILVAQVRQQDKMLAQQVDFSLSDLQNAIKIAEINLVALKGEIAISNLKKLERKLSQSSSDSNSQK
jgi:hypothetical protein